jgi:hypothetical protein
MFWPLQHPLTALQRQCIRRTFDHTAHTCLGHQRWQDSDAHCSMCTAAWLTDQADASSGCQACLPSVLAASAAGVCQACKDPRFKIKKGCQDVGSCWSWSVPMHFMQVAGHAWAGATSTAQHIIHSISWRWVLPCPAAPRQAAEHAVARWAHLTHTTTHTTSQDAAKRDMTQSSTRSCQCPCHSHIAGPCEHQAPIHPFTRGHPHWPAC